MVSPAREDIKICDFGFCQEIDNSRHQYSVFGTPEFVAPEIVHQEPVTVATDIWYQILWLVANCGEQNLSCSEMQFCLLLLGE